jgi:hypothetical protein
VYQPVNGFKSGRVHWKVRAKKRASDSWDSTRGFFRVAVLPSLKHAAEHTYTIAAFVCADWASWMWNAKAGLITAAILLIAFELKVGS